MRPAKSQISARYRIVLRVEPLRCARFRKGMQRCIFTTVFSLTFALVASAATQPQSPDQIFGRLFEDVQRASVFEDQKTFVDCVPRELPAEILRKYAEEKGRPGFQLTAFVEAHFIVPPALSVKPSPTQEIGRAHV